MNLVGWGGTIQLITATVGVPRDQALCGRRRNVRGGLGVSGGGSSLPLSVCVAAGSLHPGEWPALPSLTLAWLACSQQGLVCLCPLPAHRSPPAHPGPRVHCGAGQCVSACLFVDCTQSPNVTPEWRGRPSPPPAPACPQKGPVYILRSFWFAPV